MAALSFIFYTLAMLIIGFIVICVVAVTYEIKSQEKENEALKQELQKLRSRKFKSEYKKVKEVKNDK